MIMFNEVKPEVSAEARRRVDLVRREIKKVFLNVDVLITPTMKMPPGTITAALNGRNAGGGLNSVGAFDVYGLPAITVPCGFTTSGLPIGLQISAGPFAESTVLAVAHVYEQATDWHTRPPALKSV